MQKIKEHDPIQSAYAQTYIYIYIYVVKNWFRHDSVKIGDAS